MKCLMMGGTLFLGRAIVDAALDAGHDVTLFNRGRTNPGIYPDLELLVGDRDADLSSLQGRAFDAVFDTSGYFPRQVRSLVDALDDVGHYTFVSSASAYADHSVPGADETAQTDTVDDPSVETLGPNYGGFKALCEAALDEMIPGQAHHVRAGLIVGPHDNTGRFSYWVERIATGGAVLAPEPRSQPVQFIDVRDIARWIIHAAETDVTGAVNAIGNPGELTMESMLTTIADTVHSSPSATAETTELAWVDETFLVEQEVSPWQDLPLWLPPTTLPDHVGFMSRDNSKARRLGLELRPLSDTVGATLEWLQSPDHRIPGKDFGNDVPPAGLTAERERALLDLTAEVWGRPTPDH